ncbi:MAG: hypothetical protein RMJ38_02410 [candidate division WOR-3 bacterium]|nr:hypothetical protein [candidate division WOR-3 bacterium]MDW8150281.1 hypothetical protein [candidate division WOR-3 bacterium]
MEIKLMVENAIDELKNKGLSEDAIDRAISYWSEISNVDIKSINESTPFDIDIVNKLLSTFPGVLSRIQDFKEEIIEIPEFSIEEFKSEEVSEDLEKELEALMHILSAEEETPKSVSKELEEELQELAFSLADEQTQEQKISEIRGVRLVGIVSNNKLERFFISKELEYKPNLSKLIETISNLWSMLGLNLEGFSSFHVKLEGLILYGEKKDDKIYIVLAESETIGGAKFLVYGLSRA